MAIATIVASRLGMRPLRAGLVGHNPKKVNGGVKHLGRNRDQLEPRQATLAGERWRFLVVRISNDGGDKEVDDNRYELDRRQ